MYIYLNQKEKINSKAILQLPLGENTSISQILLGMQIFKKLKGQWLQ